MLLFLNLRLCDRLTWLLKLITDYESCSFTFVYLYPLGIWAIIFPANRKCGDACHSVTACMLTVQWPDVFVWPPNELLQFWSLSKNWLQVNGLPVCHKGGESACITDVRQNEAWREESSDPELQKWTSLKRVVIPSLFYLFIFSPLR